MLLLDRILERVESDPAARACVSGGEVLSYLGFLALWSVATRYLHEQGIGAGQPVALTMSQSPLHLVVFLALARLGALVQGGSALRGVDPRGISRRARGRGIRRR